MELRELYIKYLQSKNVENIDTKLNEFDTFYKCRFRNKYLSNELNDFLDFILNRKSKGEAFLDFIENTYKNDKYKKILDVEIAYNDDFALLLKNNGYNVTLVDRNMREDKLKFLKTIQKAFDYRIFDVNDYDLLVGLNAEFQTEHVLRSAVCSGKPFAILLNDEICSTINGDNVYTTEKWHDYLNGLYPGKTKIIKYFTSGKQLKIIKNR